MDRLRSPGGCPWDAEQTHESLVRHAIEEVYELADAIATEAARTFARSSGTSSFRWSSTRASRRSTPPIRSGSTRWRRRSPTNSWRVTPTSSATSPCQGPTRFTRTGNGSRARRRTAAPSWMASLRLFPRCRGPRRSSRGPSARASRYRAEAGVGRRDRPARPRRARRGRGRRRGGRLAGRDPDPSSGPILDAEAARSGRAS